MTLYEIEQSINAATQSHTYVHMNFHHKSSGRYWKYSAVVILKDYRAEALLLMLLDKAYYHGYTPNNTAG